MEKQTTLSSQARPWPVDHEDHEAAGKLLTQDLLLGASATRLAWVVDAF